MSKRILDSESLVSIIQSVMISDMLFLLSNRTVTDKCSQKANDMEVQDYSAGVGVELGGRLDEGEFRCAWCMLGDTGLRYLLIM